jgi:uncharacterized membrane protein YebE (DUF533 family)
MAVTVEAAKQYQEEQTQKTASQIGSVAVGGGASESAPVVAKKKMDYKKIIFIAVGVGVVAYFAYKYFINKGKGKGSDNGIGVSGAYSE